MYQALLFFNLGLIFFFNLVFIFGSLYMIFSSFIVLFRGAPFVPSKKQTVKEIVALAKVKTGEKALDLGSGDGRIVIALAKAGAIAKGYELNPLLVWWSRRKIKREGLEGRAFIYRKDFWKEDFSSFNVITVYGLTSIMAKLENKLKKELRPGSRVVSNAFKFPVWKPDIEQGTVRTYIV